MVEVSDEFPPVNQLDFGHASHLLDRGFEARDGGERVPQKEVLGPRLGDYSDTHIAHAVLLLTQFQGDEEGDALESTPVGHLLLYALHSLVPRELLQWVIGLGADSLQKGAFRVVNGQHIFPE